MGAAYIVLVVLISLKSINCDVELSIYRIIDDYYSPVNLAVEEKAGSNLTLFCELSSTEPNDTGGDQIMYDDQIVWGKAAPDFSFKNKTDLEVLAENKSSSLYLLVRPQRELNRASKVFAPLKAGDEGTYFCGSLKYTVFEIVYIVLRKEKKQSPYRLNFNSELKEISFCNDKMFRCKSNGVCIHQNYVCDRKPDCADGSDESFETCKGDPCRNKLECDDGRCIPSYWCCDRHHDLECNVTYPPSCCQQLAKPFEELEYGNVPYNMTQVRTNGTRYIFISLCILATFFSIVLMLLILSKVFLFAKKTSCPSPHDGYPLNDRTTFRPRISSRPIAWNYVVRPYEEHDLTTGTMDSLLILSDDIIRFGDNGDRPPSYSDVMGQMEPPPPYTSQDCLNR